MRTIIDILIVIVIIQTESALAEMYLNSFFFSFFCLSCFGLFVFYLSCLMWFWT